MFKKILIANRGEIAVRIARTCREMGIPTVAVYQAADETSLHIRLADECVLLQTPRGLNDQQALLEIARAKGVDAIHPGYGFLAENVEFACACAAAGITFIGPPADAMQQVLDKIKTLDDARAAGFKTIEHASVCGDENQLADLHVQAERLVYPVVVKSCRGGRGRGARLVNAPEELAEALASAQAESYAVYGERSVYLEKAICPAHQVGVQILADRYGNLIHLGEREGSLLSGNQKLLEESPAPCLNDQQRSALWETALALAAHFHIANAVTVEFLVDAAGETFFTEIKPRIQVEHPLTELRTRLDLVRQQIRLAAGEPLSIRQQDVFLQGCAMLCSIQAQNPQQNFMPSPGRVRVRFSNGPETRLDTYIYSGAVVPSAYDSLIAKLSVWAADRPDCLARMERALHELSFNGISTNVPQLRQLVWQSAVRDGTYTTATTPYLKPKTNPLQQRDLAIAAALLYIRTGQGLAPVTPERLTGNWHHAARALPE